MTTAPSPAGWYDDPERNDRQRWWDGTSWSDARRRKPPALTGAPPGDAPSSHLNLDPTSMHGGVIFRNDAVDGMLATPVDRLSAAVLDGVMAVVVLAAVGLIGAVLGVLPDALEALIAGALSLAAWVVIIAANVMGEGRLGQSYGKHAVGISVVSTRTGEPIGSAAALGRGIVRGIGSYAVGLGVLWMLWDPRRQGWHDKAVSSIVVKVQGAPKVDTFTFLRAIVDNDSGWLTRRERANAEP